jgi:hypothetical protein
MGPLQSVRKSKFGAIRTQVDGIEFASKMEARRYVVLKSHVGKTISDLQLQPTFVLQESFRYGNEAIRKIEYKADFSYTVGLGGSGETCFRVVEDVKGMETPDFKIKLKIWKKLYGHLYQFRLVKGAKAVSSSPI